MLHLCQLTKNGNNRRPKLLLNLAAILTGYAMMIISINAKPKASKRISKRMLAWKD